MAHLKLHEAVILQARYDDDLKHLWIELRGGDGQVYEVASKGSFVIVGRGGKKSLLPAALVPDTRVNVEADTDGLCDLLVQVLGMDGASLLDEEKFIAVRPDTAASLSQMKGQIERVQHNLNGLSLLQEMREQLAQEDRKGGWLDSVEFRVNRGSADSQGKAAAPLLLHVVKDMMPEIIERTIAYAENGNKEAMAAIGALAENLKD